MLLTGILFIVTTGIAYLPSALQNGMYEFELTFLSNTIAGFAFFSRRNIRHCQKERPAPAVVYEYCYTAANGISDMYGFYRRI